MTVEFTNQDKEKVQNFIYDLLYDKDPDAYEEKEHADGLYDEINNQIGHIEEFTF